MSKKKKINPSKENTVRSINNNIRSSVRKLNPILKAFKIGLSFLTLDLILLLIDLTVFSLLGFIFFFLLIIIF